MSGRKDRILNMCMLDGDHSSRDGAVFQHHVTTVDNFSRELFSIDDLYVNHGFSVSPRQPDFGSARSKLFRAATTDQPELSIPLRHDHENGDNHKILNEKSRLNTFTA